MGRKNNVTILNAIYIVLAISLLLCLFRMPYGFYVFVRFATAASFAYMAYKAGSSGNKDRMILFIILTLLFQPFIKLSLGRTLWNIIDVAVAILLCYYLFKDLMKK